MADGSPALFSGIPLWADILLSGALVTISAYFAGTTLGVISLDKISLQIVAEASDDPNERRHASAIFGLSSSRIYFLHSDVTIT
jgi:hypothetical protein